MLCLAVFDPEKNTPDFWLRFASATPYRRALVAQRNPSKYGYLVANPTPPAQSTSGEHQAPDTSAASANQSPSTRKRPLSQTEPPAPVSTASTGASAQSREPVPSIPPPPKKPKKQQGPRMCIARCKKPLKGCHVAYCCDDGFPRPPGPSSKDAVHLPYPAPYPLPAGLFVKGEFQVTRFEELHSFVRQKNAAHQLLDDAERNFLLMCEGLSQTNSQGEQVIDPAPLQEWCKQKIEGSKVNRSQGRQKK